MLRNEVSIEGLWMGRPSLYKYNHKYFKLALNQNDRVYMFLFSLLLHVLR